LRVPELAALKVPFTCVPTALIESVFAETETAPGETNRVSKLNNAVCVAYSARRECVLVP
jgi:hypothetical protein